MLIIFLVDFGTIIIFRCFQFAASPGKLLSCTFCNSIQVKELFTIQYSPLPTHYPIHPNLNESGINAKISGTIIENPMPNAFTIFKYFLLCKPSVLNAL